MERVASRPRLMLGLALLGLAVACQPVPQIAPTASPPAAAPFDTPSAVPSETSVPSETPAPSPTPFPNPVVVTTGKEQIIYDWSRQRCEKLDIPDFSARAFRDADGNVQLIVSHYITYRFIGPDLEHLKHHCSPVMQSAANFDASQWSYHQWLASPYTEDGRTIYALIHDEYYGPHNDVSCRGGGLACWYNAITLALSTDGGASYHPVATPPGNYVVSSNHPYEASAGPYGYFDPSNIIKAKDGYYYAFERMHYYNTQGTGAGICVMRTDNLADPASWRGWDGSGFTVRFVDPYVDPAGAAASPGCTSLPPNGIGLMSHSVTWNTYLNRYVMVGITWIFVNGADEWGVAYSFSDDLIHWSPRKMVIDIGNARPLNYASLLDPSSTDRNFNTTGKTAYIYMTRFNDRTGGDHLDRDLVRFPVEFLPEPPPVVGATGGQDWEFDKAGDAQGWKPWNQLQPFGTKDGHLVMHATGNDPYMGSPVFQEDAKTSPKVTISMKVSAGEWAQLFFITATQGNWDEAKSLRFPITSDGQFHEYVVDLSHVPAWEGAITQLRLDPVEVPADIEIDYIRLGH